jgi:hypothetical protein
MSDPVTPARSRTPLLAVLALSLALGAACARPASTGSIDRGAPTSTTNATPPARRPASTGELASYAQRERQVQGLEKFAGGRISNGTLTTVVLVLLIVLLILIIV